MKAARRPRRTVRTIPDRRYLLSAVLLDKQVYLYIKFVNCFRRHRGRASARESRHENNTEEAFVKVLQIHGIRHAFGIIGSAFMPISDLFERGRRHLLDAAHENNAGMMCDGYTRSTGAIGMVIGKTSPA